MKPLVFALSLATAALVFSPSISGAAEVAGAPARKPQLEPAAEELLVTAAAFHAARKSATAEIATRLIQDFPEMPIHEESVAASFAIAHPNRLSLRSKPAAPEGMTLVSDGRTVWTFLTELKQFTVDDAPADLETLLRDNEQVAENLAPFGILADLFRAKPAEVIKSPLTSLKLAGEEDVQGTKCARLRGEQEDMDWTAWFQTGPEPALRKIVFSPLKGILAAAPDEVKSKLKGARYEVTATFDDWKFDAQIPEATFAFEPPKEAKKVAAFGPPEEETAAAGPAAEGPEKLKGQPAPDFTLDLLAGGKMQLAQHKGKEVVVLDFWATWCPPCVRGLPSLGELAAAYKEKGVVVYAVNQKEEADVVKKFLETKKLALTVPMDAKGAAAKLYQVRGIPQTVIVGKDGNIAAVHVGFSPGMKETLTKEIEAALAK